jgi:hypothetical protein
MNFVDADGKAALTCFKKSGFCVALQQGGRTARGVQGSRVRVHSHRLHPTAAAILALLARTEPSVL